MSAILPARRDTIALAPAPAPATLAQVQAPTWLDNLQVAAAFAKAVADTSLVPGWARHDPPAVTAVILKGLEIGLPPMASLGSIILIDGKPAIYAAAQRALVTTRGHDIWPEELTDARAIWAGRRLGTERITRITWTMERARIARISSKDVWQKYPGAMLSARASAALITAIFSEVVLGLVVAEEFDVVPPELLAENDRPAEATTSRQRTDTPGPSMPSAPATEPTPTRARRRARPPLPNEPAAAEPAVNPEPEEAQRPSQGQMKRLHGLMGAKGWQREQRLRYASIVTDREITSSNELTAEEAGRIIDLLDLAAQPEAAGDDLQPIAEEARVQWLDATVRALDPTDRELLSVALIQRADVGVGEVLDGALLARLFPDLGHVVGESLHDAYGRLLAAVEPPPEQVAEPEPEHERPKQGDLDPPARRRARRRPAPEIAAELAAPEPASPEPAPDVTVGQPPREGEAASGSFPDDLDDLQPEHEQPTLGADPSDLRTTWRIVIAGLQLDRRADLAGLLHRTGLAADDYGTDVDRIADVIVTHVEQPPSTETLDDLIAHLETADGES